MGGNIVNLIRKWLTAIFIPALDPRAPNIVTKKNPKIEQQVG